MDFVDLVIIVMVMEKYVISGKITHDTVTKTPYDIIWYVIS